MRVFCCIRVRVVHRSIACAHESRVGLLMIAQAETSTGIAARACAFGPSWGCGLQQQYLHPLSLPTELQQSPILSETGGVQLNSGRTSWQRLHASGFFLPLHDMRG
jgi:hypothetical protein